jgi:hypothetical protein
MTALYSTTEAAKRLGVGSSRVRQLAIRLAIGTRISGGWVFTEADIDRLRQRNQQLGRPRKDEER